MPAKRKTEIVPAEEWPPKKAPSKAQIAEMENVKKRRLERRPALPVAAQRKHDGTMVVDTTVTDRTLGYERLLDATGTRSEAWLDGVTKALCNSTGSSCDGDPESTLKQGLAFLNGLGPADEVQAALGVQMFTVHQATLTATRRMAQADDRRMYMDYANAATKLQRTFVAQVEALAKLKNGGKQQVEVRYVYVDARGGQNIIASQVGGGRDQQNEQQPRVPGLSFAPGAEVWGADPTRLRLPATGDAGKEAVPQTWREESGSADWSGERELQERPPHEGGEG